MRLSDLYRHAWRALAPEGFPEVDRVEPPRSPEVVFEMVSGLGLGPQSRVLDLACGPGRHAAELARRHGVRVVGVDPVIGQLRDARAASSLQVLVGAMESVPLAPASVDLVWLRDALLHSNDPEATLHSCARVLRPGGHLLVHTAFATELLATHELELLESDVRARREALDRERVDRAAADAGFEVVRQMELGSELAEHYDDADGLGGRALSRLARLRRSEDLEDRLGEAQFRSAWGLYHWVVFEFLGKLTYRTSLFRKREST